MRWACFALLVIGLLGLFAYQYAGRERSWDEAPEERGLAEGPGHGWLDPWSWLWPRGADGMVAGGPGFHQKHWWWWRQRRREQGQGRRRRRLRSAVGVDWDWEEEWDEQEEHEAMPAGRGSDNTRPWRELQLLEAGALRPFEQLANFTTVGLRRAPPYGPLSECYFNRQCFNVATPGYGTVSRCKFGRICNVCRGTPGRQNCTFVRVTGNPAGLGAQTSLSNVVIPSD